MSRRTFLGSTSCSVPNVVMVVLLVVDIVVVDFLVAVVVLVVSVGAYYC